MLSLRKPSVDALRLFLAAQRELPFTYGAVGATAGTPPAGYVVDRTRIKLGEGEAVFRSAAAALRRWGRRLHRRRRGRPVFRSAAAALRRWEQFALGWVEAWSPDTPIRAGEVVAVMGRAVGVWWLNACRVVYAVDGAGPVTKFGFAYGTLPGHVESGEERFLVEWDKSDDGVWYDILAFSRPNQFSARLGYPVVRRLQKRFGRDSAAAMRRAVGAGGAAKVG